MPRYDADVSEEPYRAGETITMIAGSSAVSPRSDRVLDTVTAALAVWTVLCHGVVLTGSNTRTLVTVALLTLFGWTIWRLRRPGTASKEGSAGFGLEYSEVQGWPWWRWLALAVPPLLAWGLHTFPQRRVDVWWAAVLYLAVVAAFELWGSRRRTVVAAPTSSRASETMVWILAALAVLVTLAVYRYNMDDVFYLSMAVDVADRPDIPLLSLETLHGIPDLPMRHTGYRFYTLEPLAGSLAFLTGIDVIYWVHWGFAGLAAALLVFAYARLLRLLVPGRWPWCLVAVLLILGTFADGFGWNGAMAFVRLQQSKAIFVSVFLPLMIAYAIEHAQNPSRRTWWNLLVVQVAAAGITTTALWITPVVVALGLASGVRLDRRVPRTFVLGLITSAYPVLLAAGLMLVAMRDAPPDNVSGASPTMPETVLAQNGQPEYGQPEFGAFVFASDQDGEGEDGPIEDEPLDPPSPLDLPEEEAIDPDPGDFSALDSIGTMASAKRYILGTRRFGWILGITAALAWCFSAETLARRFALVFPLGFLVFLYNPLFANIISRFVTRDYTYWRVFWVLPGPILMALCLTAPMALRRSRWRSLLTVGLIGSMILLGPNRYQWYRVKEFVSLWPIRLKVTPEYEVAELLSRHTPQNAQVLAPWGVSAWLTTVHGHPYPLSVRRYLTRYQRELGGAEINFRHRMTSMMTGLRRRPTRRLVMRAIRAYKIGAVCYPKRLVWDEDPVAAFHHHGFKLVYEDDTYIIWVKPPEHGSATPRRPHYLRPASPVPIAPRRLPRA